MFISFRFRSIAIILAILWHRTVADSVNYPVGISLGLQYFSSAKFNGNNEFVQLAKIAASKEWQEYHQLTWNDARKHLPRYDPALIAMFTRALLTIQSATSAALNETKVEYRSVTAPWHFAHRSSISTLMRATYDLHYISEDQGYQVISLHNAARLAYDLDKCRGFGLPATCDVEEEDFLVFVLEFINRHVVASFLNIGHHLCIDVDVRRFLMGANATTLENTASEIGTFVHEMVGYQKEMGMVDPDSHIFGILWVGEDNQEEIDEMKIALGNVLPEFKGRFVFSIPPEELAVRGAAHRAQQYVTENMYLTPREPWLHEEL